MKKFIVISGKAEHGKTTFAHMLAKHLEGRVVVTLYAYYLKDLAKRYCGWDGAKDEAGRNLLQELGTDVIRRQLEMPDFHVNRICEDAYICKDYVDYVIVDDTRFPNEIEVPKEKFGADNVISIHIDRPNHKSHLTPEQLAHPSETALDGYEYDFYVHNDGTLEDLEENYGKSIAEFILHL